MSRMKFPDGKKNPDGSITSAYPQRNFKDARKMALEAPVAITIHGRKELMLITREAFDQMTSTPDATRQDPAGSAPRTQPQI